MQVKREELLKAIKKILSYLRRKPKLPYRIENGRKIYETGHIPAMMCDRIREIWKDRCEK